jgi:hypothetical protein
MLAVRIKWGTSEGFNASLLLSSSRSSLFIPKLIALEMCPTFSLRTEWTDVEDSKQLLQRQKLSLRLPARG